MLDSRQAEMQLEDGEIKELYQQPHMQRNVSASKYFDYEDIKSNGQMIADMMTLKFYKNMKDSEYLVLYNGSNDHSYFNISDKYKSLRKPLEKYRFMGGTLAHISLHHSPSVNQQCGASHLQYNEIDYCVRLFYSPDTRKFNFESTHVPTEFERNILECLNEFFLLSTGKSA